MQENKNTKMNTLYRLTKIKASNDAKYSPAENVETYRRSLLLGRELSPPIDYYVEGYLIHSLDIGDCLLMDRINRNGIAINGYMRTSPITHIEYSYNETHITTENSIYKLEEAYS